MSNWNWVCFNCRKAFRRDSSVDDVICPECGTACENIGYKIRIPSSNKKKEWEHLHEEHFASKCAMIDDSHRSEVRRRHDVEGEIRRLESMPVNEGRKSAIKALKKHLK